MHYRPKLLFTLLGLRPPRFVGQNQGAVREQTIVEVSTRVDKGRNLASNSAEMKVFLNRGEDGGSMF